MVTAGIATSLGDEVIEDQLLAREGISPLPLVHVSQGYTGNISLSAIVSNGEDLSLSPTCLHDVAFNELNSGITLAYFLHYLPISNAKYSNVS
jgi:hypothetical protein